MGGEGVGVEGVVERLLGVWVVRGGGLVGVVCLVCVVCMLRLVCLCLVCVNSTVHSVWLEVRYSRLEQ